MMTTKEQRYLVCAISFISGGSVTGYAANGLNGIAGMFGLTLGIVAIVASIMVGSGEFD